MYEYLWNGERVRAIRNQAGVWLMGREGRSLSNRFPRIAAAVARLRTENAVIDGEILHLSNYSDAAVDLLRRNSDEANPGQLAFLAYDLLHYRGEDLRDRPLLGRRLILASLLQGSPLLLAPVARGEPPEVMREAARLGLAGVVAKRAGSPYQPNALTHQWLKVIRPESPGPAPADHEAAKASLQAAQAGPDVR